jgi:hypothetical protein
MRRYADDAVVADDASGGRDRQIVLADVHTVRRRETRDIGAIIDDDLRARGMRHRNRRVRERQPLTGGRALVADLDQSCAAGKERGQDGERLEAPLATEINVENWLEKVKH